MLRVKVFSLKEIIRRVIVGVCISIIIYCFVLVFLRFINIESRSFAANIVEENINTETFSKRGTLNTKILQSELNIEDKILKNDIVLVKEETSDSNRNQEIISDNELTVENTQKVDEKYLETSVIKTWNRPKTYKTNLLTSGKVQVGNSYIMNYSKLNLNLNELSKVSDFKIDNNTSILIFHTHTSEAYSEMGKNTNFRTTDDSCNMVSVGKVLKENLLLKNFDVMHSTTKHDTPSYNGAYKASLQTVQNLFKEKKYDIVLDIHRDALSGNLNFRPTTEINGESAAKLMFVVGTNSSGLSHDNWMENLKLALLIQNTANEMYPGLFRDLNLSKSRYNQHVCSGALILEVGATGNTLEEAWTAMKYFSNVLDALKNK